MKFSALRFASFSSLGQAITDWSQMSTKLKSLSDDANDQLKGRAGKANWKGVNATVTREFITKTSREFADAHAQAQSIHNILGDVKNELEGYKKQLDDRIDRGFREHNLTVTESGDSFTVEKFMGPVSPSDSASPSKTSQADVDALRDDISAILEKATTSDKTAADAVKSIVSATEQGFANVSYHDRDSAARALREAERLADLAKNPADLSPEEFDELNRGMGAFHYDPLFSERFAVKLGPEGALKLWATINDGSLSRELIEQRGAEYGDMQQNLGLTLASATQSDSPAMRTWERGMVDLGGKDIQTSSGLPYTKGFVLMSSLMKRGDYDDRFLNDYGDKLIEYEKKNTNSTSNADDLWMSGLSPNHLGDDPGADPMTGYLEALGRSPEAAEKFLNADYGDLRSDAPEKTLSNFEYLFEEREWLEEGTDGYPQGDEGHEAMAHAIQAATTGHSFNESPSLENIPHSRGQAELYAALVQSVSEDPSRLTQHPAMSESFGQMSAEYMPDIHRSLDSAIGAEEERLYPMSGASADLGERDLTRFMYSVGRDPEGYAAINLGQHNYTANLMQHHLENTGAVINDPGERANVEQVIGTVSQRAGEIQGTIAAGRAYEAEVEGGARDAEFNKALDGAKAFAEGLVSIGAGIATAEAGPGGIVASEAATRGADALLDSIVERHRIDNSDEVIYRNGQEWDDTKESTYDSVRQAARDAGTSTNSKYTNALALLAPHSAEVGFDHAASNVGEYLRGEGVPHDLPD